MVLLVLVGVGLFGASYDAYRNLSDSYNEIFTTYKFADLLLVGGNTKKIASTAQATSGVGDNQVRTVADVPFRVPGGDKFVGRAVGMPTMSQPTVDQVDVEKGTYLNPSDPNGVLVETHLAGDFGLGVGDTVDVWSGTAWQHTKILGFVSSPEYLWPAESRQNVLPAPKSFGVLFVPQALATTTAKGNGVRHQSGRALLPRRGTRRRGHPRHPPRRHGAGQRRQRRRDPRRTTQQRHPERGHPGVQQLAVLFPLLFLTAAGMATYVVLTRRVARDRAVIGMLRASGFGRRPLAVHYLWTRLIVGIGGALPGVIVGVLAAGALTRVYTHAIGIPVTVVHINAATVLVGLAFGVVAGALSALAPALSAARVPPAKRCAGSNPPADAPLRLGGTHRPRAAPDAGRCLAGRAGACPQLAAHPLHRDRHRAGADPHPGLLGDARLDERDAQPAVRPGATRERAGHACHAGNPRGAGPDVGHQRRRRRRTFEPAARHDRHRAGRLRDRSGRLHPRHHNARVPATRRRSPGVTDSGLLLGVELQHRLHLSTGGQVAAQVPGHKRADVEVAGFVDEPLGTFAYASLDQVAQLTPGNPPVDRAAALHPERRPQSDPGRGAGAAPVPHRGREAATAEEIQEAAHYAKMSLVWSASLNRMQEDFDQFAEETRSIVAYVRARP